MVPSKTPDAVTLHVDYDKIVELIEPGSSVLDLGCGDGSLLLRLKEERQVRGRGVEIDEANVIQCLDKGVSVIHADIDEPLTEFADDTFDYVILNWTLQVVQKPDFVVCEMLRIGRRAIVSFPNMGHWRGRLQLLFCGRQARTRVIPFSWYDTPNIYLCTIKEFRQFCREESIRIEHEIPIVRAAASSNGLVRLFPNLMAEEGIFVLGRF